MSYGYQRFVLTKLIEEGCYVAEIGDDNEITAYQDYSVVKNGIPPGMWSLEPINKTLLMMTSDGYGDLTRKYGNGSLFALQQEVIDYLIDEPKRGEK